MILFSSIMASILQRRKLALISKEFHGTEIRGKNFGGPIAVKVRNG